MKVRINTTSAKHEGWGRGREEKEFLEGEGLEER